ncbi:MAG: glycosyltransferase family 4 protein [Thermoguttaceae bacterium]|jgi:colanic acid biosynthesis glycosyl transferase WcaI
MNILLISYVYPPEHAPTGVNFSELAEDLVKSGHRVTILTGWPSHPEGKLYPGWRAKFRSKEQTEQGYCLIRCGHSLHLRQSIPWKLWYFFTFAVSSFINGLFSGKTDVVVSCSTPLFGPWTSWVLAKLKRARHVYWIHDIHPEAISNAGMIREASLAYRLMLASDKFICRHSTLVATLTEDMRQNLIARGLNPDKVILMLHWVDAKKITPCSSDNPWRREHEIELGKFIVLHAGTIGFISGAGVIIDAARIVANRWDILFLVVGDGPLKEKLVEKTQEYALNNVKFLPFQSADVLAQVQATGNVGLVTLLPESGASSIPSKMHGYTAAGKPVIASVADATATAKMIRNNDFGIVCPVQDAQALAAAILRLADNPAETERLGRNALEFFLSTYDREICTRKAERILASLV